jgi:hypothetical protein
MKSIFVLTVGSLGLLSLTAHADSASETDRALQAEAYASAREHDAGANLMNDRNSREARAESREVARENAEAAAAAAAAEEARHQAFAEMLANQSYQDIAEHWRLFANNPDWKEKIPPPRDDLNHDGQAFAYKSKDGGHKAFVFIRNEERDRIHIPKYADPELQKKMTEKEHEDLVKMLGSEEAAKSYEHKYGEEPATTILP